MSLNELLVCVDCAMLTANGELGQGDRDADLAHAERMMRHLSPIPSIDLVVSCEEGTHIDFSSRPCDGCGSTLAGSRCPAVVLGPCASLL